MLITAKTEHIEISRTQSWAAIKAEQITIQHCNINKHKQRQTRAIVKLQNSFAKADVSKER